MGNIKLSMVIALALMVVLRLFPLGIFAKLWEYWQENLGIKKDPPKLINGSLIILFSLT